MRTPNINNDITLIRLIPKTIAIPAGAKAGEKFSLIIPKEEGIVKNHAMDIINKTTSVVNVDVCRRGIDAQGATYVTKPIDGIVADIGVVTPMQLIWAFASGNGISISVTLKADVTSSGEIEIIITEIGGL